MGDARHLEKVSTDWELPNWVESTSYDTSCLIPYFDMLNNNPKVANSYTYNRRDGQFEIKSSNGIELNGQVFINYGSFGMLDILLDYGYLHENADFELTVTIDEIQQSCGENFESPSTYYVIYEHCIDVQLVNFLDQINHPVQKLFEFLIRKYTIKLANCGTLLKNEQTNWCRQINQKSLTLLKHHFSQIKNDS